MSDQEWKPKMRPQSTMAQAFSSALDSAFMLDSDVNNLSQTVDQKKQQMMIQNRELEELQNRIREAEQRLLSSQKAGVAPAGSGQQASQGSEHSEQRANH